MRLDTNRLLRAIARACDDDDRKTAARMLAFLPEDVVAEIGTRLDSSSIVQLNRWSLL